MYFIPQKEIIVNRFENPFDRHEKNTESGNEMSCWRDRTRLSWTFTVRERKNEVYPDWPWTLWFRFWFFCPCPTSSRIIWTRREFPRYQRVPIEKGFSCESPGDFGRLDSDHDDNRTRPFGKKSRLWIKKITRRPSSITRASWKDAFPKGWERKACDGKTQ